MLPVTERSTETTPLRVRLLGRFSVSDSEHTITDAGWRLRKARSLVKLLVLTPDHRLHREQIMASLWPELDSAAAANNLYQALHAARKMLDTPNRSGPSCLQVQNEIVSLCPDRSLWIDLEAFERAAVHARRARTVAAYRAAIDLYAGDLLPDDRYEDWASERRDGLRREYGALLLELAALYEGEGETQPAIETLQRLLKHDPTHEEAHRRLVALFALSGNLHRARHQYQILKEVLRRELDAEPDPQSQQLYHDILAGRLPGAKPAVERPAAATAVWTSALDETYGALSDQERLAFRRLAIFAGGFSQEAAAMAWGGEIEKGRVPALLTRLSERSLIIPDRHGYEVRYRMLETVRRYARLQLDRAGETDPTLGRHSHWFVSLAERAEAELSRPDQALWLRQLDADRENLRAALEFCREHDPLPGARLAAALWQYWEIRGEPAEGRRWLEEMLARAQPDLPVEPRARMLLGTGTLASRQGDHRGAQPLLEESLRLFEDIGDRWGIAWSLDNLGMLSLSEGNVGEARAMFERSMALFERAGDMRGRACVLDNLGWTALMDGDPAQAQRYFERALVVFREIDDRRGIGRALANLANTLRVQGDLKSARALFAESLPYCQTTPGSRGESRWASFTQFLRRSVLLRLQLFFWSGAAGPIALPCAGVCAGYPLFAHLVSATTVPLWAVVVHLVILPIAVPVNAILLFISFRRHHRPWAFIAGGVGSLLTLAALMVHVFPRRLPWEFHNVIWGGMALLLAGVLLDWHDRRRTPAL